MKAGKEITDFMERVEKDSRLGPMHISLYLAILYCWLRQGASGSVRVSGRKLMPLAKIGGTTPMYKYLRELHAFGYIDYRPSFNRIAKSEVYLPLVEKMGYQRN